MGVNRRDFLKGTSACAFSLLLGHAINGSTKALAQEPDARGERFAMLSDLTRCVGCRRCEAACNKAKNLLPPETRFEDPSVFEKKRRTEPNAYTVVNRYTNPKWKKPVYRKIQCNHCVEPACASACLVGALRKTPQGPVIYNEEVCLGCRYCMTACPFYIPTFEYFDAYSPRIRKCTMCYHRISQGKGLIPACAEACSVRAITFGKRSEIIKLARDRIMSEPARYINHIYGENEAGGTDWLYISGVPFEELDFPTDLETTPYPGLTREFLSAVPLVITVWPAIFGGLYILTKRREQIDEVRAQTEQRSKSTDDR